MRNEFPRKSEKNFVGCVVNAAVWSIPVQVAQIRVVPNINLEMKKHIYHERTDVTGLSSVVLVKVPSIALSSI
jgi:hypothetical protein